MSWDQRATLILVSAPIILAWCLTSLTEALGIGSRFYCPRNHTSDRERCTCR